MPYCEPCQRYHTPSAMNADGTCPRCGEPIDTERVTESVVDEATPWHFKLLVTAVVVYLGWRFVELVELVV